VNSVLRRTTPNRSRTLGIVMAGALTVGLAGCTGFKESIGATKQMPDETSVETRAPLVVPATFDLKPPQPGAPRPQDSDTAAAAQRVLGGSPKTTPASEGEKALLSVTGAEKADGTIRRELSQEVRDARKRKSYSDTVLFWRGRKGDPGTPINPGEEAQRVATVQSMPVADQDAPVIKKADEKASAPAEPETKVESEPKGEESGGWFDWF
jgi:Protein of unknown function (DUF3035)